MGAESFLVRETGSTLLEAFQKAVRQAQWEYGHRGYSGTIAEKSAVREVLAPSTMGSDEEKIAWAISLLHDEITDQNLCWIEDKWGPAAALRLTNEEWLFFGWASC